MQEAKNIDTHKNKFSFSLEKSGDISIEQETKTRESLDKAISELEKEWFLSSPVNIFVHLMSDEKFREGAKEGDPHSKKYCFLLRDQFDNRVYVNTSIFSVLPEKVNTMIKHELAHIVVGNLVNNPSAYRKSFILEEGTAGLDNATELLVEKLKRKEL